jgi:gamma-glutamylcyclotransferase (GGCT)/AIG2-like uncharacterized protein YtfP
MTPEMAKALLVKFEKATDAEKWRMPFPMGVFGTLRMGCGNDSLMHRNGKYCDHQKAFLPHFYGQGLSITCEENSTCPFEIYFYKPDQWEKMINSVDSLEGCHPMIERSKSKGDWGYYRTLAWLYMLPDNFSPLFNNCNSKKIDEKGLTKEDKWYRSRGGISLYDKRDLEIGKEKWRDYDRVPCWIYSSRGQNKLAMSLDPNPIIWG